KSNLDHDLHGTLAFVPHSGLACPQFAKPFTLPARLRTQVEFALTATESGILPTELRVDAGQTQVRRPITFRAFAGSKALADIDAEYAEKAHLSVPGHLAILYLRGGHLSLCISSKDSVRDAVGQGMAQIGPPYPGWLLRAPLYEARIENADSDTGL